MRLLYLSAHEILEYDELSIFTELNIDCFSLGAFTDPKGHKSLCRPAVGGMRYDPELEDYVNKFPKTGIPKDVFDKFDVIVIMHQPEWVTENWERMKHKKVIWRSIGQSTRSVENMIRKCRYSGLKIVRYSPMEQNLPDYLGADAIIRFYKDPKEFGNYNGNEKRVINFTQTLKGRRLFCHYDQIMSMVEGFPAIIYGSGNDDLGPLNGGKIPYDLMKGALRDNRVFIYGGTWPASYTLTLIEAMMTGIPVVAIGKKMATEIQGLATAEVGDFYEVPNIITNEQNGYVYDDIGSLRNAIHRLLEDHALAKKIGQKGREKAIELFSRDKIRVEWDRFLKSL